MNKKVVKLNRNQLRQVLSEAIQGKSWGEPEPFAVNESEDIGSYEVVEAREKIGKVVSLLEMVQELLKSSKRFDKLVNSTMAHVQVLRNVLDNELEGDEVEPF